MRLLNYILTIILCLCIVQAFDTHNAILRRQERQAAYISFLPMVFQQPTSKSFFSYIAIPNFIFPVKESTLYRISSDFGIREQVIVGMGGEEGDFHRGIDIVPLSKNAKAIASADGIVALHYVPPGHVNGKFYKGHPVFGGLVVVKHAEHVYTVYGHLSKTFVYEGMRVRQGHELGIIGNTGKSTGTHLHFEILFSPIGIIDSLY